MFKITEHIEFDSSNRAVCPSCALAGKGKKKNLSIAPSGAYHCFRGCTRDEIRDALGQPKTRQVPQSAVKPTKRSTVSPQAIKKNHERLLRHPAAMKWLKNRGIDREVIERHRLGMTNAKLGKRSVESITIPIPANTDKTAYYQKKRVAPWDEIIQDDDNYQPWKQYGIPAMVYFTHKPDGATSTWLCEGEWDAIVLGHAVREATDGDLAQKVAVASFTCGAGSVPSSEQLERLPGTVYTWYDRNDKPLKSGLIPGDEGVKKVAARLKDRHRRALVPMAEDSEAHGWDVSDAIASGYGVAAFVRAAAAAKEVKPEPPKNKLREKLKWNDDLVANAPEYTDFLVPDLLTEDELFILAAPPRAGKTLLAMTLTEAVASGGKFMDRPCTQGPVIYVKCEDSDSKVRERQEAQGWAEGLPVAWLDRFRLSDMAELDALAAEIDPRLIVLDTLSRIKDSSISETSAEMSQLLDPLQDLANRRGCCVVIIHHTGKVNADTATQGDIFDTIRGSSAIRAVCRGSMVLAKGESSYRLVCENGWGKNDLRVALDANTLRWRLLGEWKPTIDLSQKEQIIAALNQLGSASVDDLHDHTGFNKKSIYKQLSRLVASDVAGEKVKKEGSRRNYTYRLELVDTIRQLDTLSTSCRIGTTIDAKSTQATSRQKSKNKEIANNFGISTRSDVPVKNVEIENHPLPSIDTPLSTIDASDPMNEGQNTSRQLVDSSSLRTSFSTTGKSDNSSSNVTVENPNSSKTDLSLSTDKNSTPNKPQYSVGDLVRYTGSKPTLARVCGRKHLKIFRINNDWIEVRHKDWAITQTIHISNLKLARKAEGANNADA